MYKNCYRCSNGVPVVVQTGICKYKTVYVCAIRVCAYKQSQP